MSTQRTRSWGDTQVILLRCRRVAQVIHWRVSGETHKNSKRVREAAPQEPEPEQELALLEPAGWGCEREFDQMDPTDPENFHEMVPSAGHRNPTPAGARTFPCSFCGREFRNAQALGGHMNVHRRERDLASQLVQLRNHEQLRYQSDRAEEQAFRILHHHHLRDDGEPTSSTPPQVQHDSASVITRSGTTTTTTTNTNMHRELQNCAGSSSSSSSPPSQPSISFATSLGCSVSTLLRRDSVDLELRLGHTPDM